jgi:RNA polymerase sigma-70 factor, ECF subfamily
MKTLNSAPADGADMHSATVARHRATVAGLDARGDGGGDAAFRGRMVKILPRLRRFAHGLTHDADQADDLVQETCARALACAEQWRPETRLDSWMYRIAQNLWIDRRRAEKVRGEIIDIAAAGDLLGCDGRTVVESRLSLLELRERIARLPPDQRVLLALICLDGLSYKEAAVAMDSPAGTVMSRLARARLALLADAPRARRAPSRTGARAEIAVEITGRDGDDDQLGSLGTGERSFEGDVGGSGA